MRSRCSSSGAMADHRVVLSVDLDDWYHARWATGSPSARWSDPAAARGRQHGPPTASRSRLGRSWSSSTATASPRRSSSSARSPTREPELVREIAGRGHEIACHGLHHVDADLLGPERFSDELAAAKKTLDTLASQPVIGYRAPNLLVRDWMIPSAPRAGLPLRRIGLHSARPPRQGLRARARCRQPVPLSAALLAARSRGRPRRDPSPGLSSPPAARGHRDHDPRPRQGVDARRAAPCPPNRRRAVLLPSLRARLATGGRIRHEERLFMRRVGPWMEDALDRSSASSGPGAWSQRRPLRWPRRLLENSVNVG